jgi:hypothetical protein
MSDLDDMIEMIEGEQLARSRVLCQLDADDDVPVGDLGGIDVIVISPGQTSALVARISWSEGSIAVDVDLFVDGVRSTSEGFTINDTTSVWTSSP